MTDTSAPKTLETDVLIVGSGGAGLRAAIEAHDRGAASVLILSISQLGKAHTQNAEGGINASLGNVDPQDSWEIHLEDTLKEGQFLGSKKMAKILVTESPDRVLELDSWGVPFNRTPEGKIDQRYFGAHRYRRTCFSADRTGLEILRALVRQVRDRKEIKIKSGIVVTSLIVKNNRSCGVTAINLLTGELLLAKAKSIILATGGFTRIYKYSTHPEESYGDGAALAYDAGAQLMDMELVQFHPTGMAWPQKYRGTLATEAFRGEGAYLLNSAGERFMKRYDPDRMELSARDVIARAIWQEVEEGRGTKHGGVWLDIRHVNHAIVRKHLPKMYRQFEDLAGVDITKEKVEVYPTAHYTMGGIVVNPATTETGIRGLFAAGETTAGLHGANRLGGNSLAETQVFGQRAGDFAADYAKRNKKFEEIDSRLVQNEFQKIFVPFTRNGKTKVNTSKMKEKIREIMWDYAGIAKTGKNLKKGLNMIKQIERQYEGISLSGSLKGNWNWLDYFAIGNMLVCCEAVIRSALLRRESRGAHFRLDYPERDDKNWLASIVCEKKRGWMTLRKVKVKL